jgi:hypothetical protein
MTDIGERQRDRLILDVEVPEERARLRLGVNPIDNDEVTKFTLEAELERLSNELRASDTDTSRKSSKDWKADSVEIKKVMKQAEEDRSRLSERGIKAFDYLKTNREKWDWL